MKIRTSDSPLVALTVDQLAIEGLIVDSLAYCLHPEMGWPGGLAYIEDVCLRLKLDTVDQAVWVVLHFQSMWTHSTLIEWVNVLRALKVDQPEGLKMEAKLWLISKLSRHGPKWNDPFHREVTELILILIAVICDA